MGWGSGAQVRPYPLTIDKEERERDRERGEQFKKERQRAGRDTKEKAAGVRPSSYFAHVMQHLRAKRSFLGFGSNGLPENYSKHTRGGGGEAQEQEGGSRGKRQRRARRGFARSPRAVQPAKSIAVSFGKSSTQPIRSRDSCVAARGTDVDRGGPGQPHRGGTDVDRGGDGAEHRRRSTTTTSPV